MLLACHELEHKDHLVGEEKQPERFNMEDSRNIRDCLLDQESLGGSYDQHKRQHPVDYDRKVVNEGIEG